MGLIVLTPLLRLFLVESGAHWIHVYVALWTRMDTLAIGAWLAIEAREG